MAQIVLVSGATNNIYLDQMGGQGSFLPITGSTYLFNGNLTDSGTNGYNLVPYTSASYINNKHLFINGYATAVTGNTLIIPKGQQNISFWIYPLPNMAEYSTIISNRHVFGAGGSTGTTILTIGSGGSTVNLYHALTPGSAGSSYFSYSAAIIDYNKWSHVVFQWDGTTNNLGLKSYVNGVYYSGATSTGVQDVNGTNITAIGKDAANASNYNGYFYMDNLIVENTIWDATKVLNHYQSYNPQNNDVLVIPDYLPNTNTKLYYNWDKNATNYNGVTGTTSGITYGSGVLKHSANFIGGTSEIKLNLNIDVTGTSITILTWLNFTSFNSGPNDIITSTIDPRNQIMYNKTTGSFMWYSFNVWSSDGGWWGYSPGLSSGATNGTTANIVSGGTQWHFFAISKNISNNTVNMYWDENSIYKSSTGITFYQYSGSNKGNQPLGSLGGKVLLNPFICKMDEIIVENRLWTDAEVLAYYKKYRPF